MTRETDVKLLAPVAKVLAELEHDGCFDDGGSQLRRNYYHREAGRLAGRLAMAGYSIVATAREQPAGAGEERAFHHQFKPMSAEAIKQVAMAGRNVAFGDDVAAADAEELLDQYGTASIAFALSEALRAQPQAAGAGVAARVAEIQRLHDQCLSAAWHYGDNPSGEQCEALKSLKSALSEALAQVGAELQRTNDGLTYWVTQAEKHRAQPQAAPAGYVLVPRSTLEWIKGKTADKRNPAVAFVCDKLLRGEEFSVLREDGDANV